MVVLEIMKKQQEASIQIEEVTAELIYTLV